MHTAPQPVTGTLVLAPVSPAIAKLLHALQAQILLEADAQATQADPMGELAAPVHFTTFNLPSTSIFEFSAANGRDTYRRRHRCPGNWGGENGIPWHPSHWRQESRRTDQAGRCWERSGGDVIHVVDDFGMLVPVPAEFQ